jgi:choline dehydrogenase-like flavoprotein
MGEMPAAAGGQDIWTSQDPSQILGTCRMGGNARDSVVDADGRSWDIANLWLGDGSLFTTTGAVNPSLTIQALACRIGERIGERIHRMAARGELNKRSAQPVL